MEEAEQITIIEGPTPDFRPDVQRWNWGIYETTEENEIAFCQLRTGNGKDIRERCVRAWREGRRVELVYPDEMRLPQTIDVVALRLSEQDEGTVLNLWLYQPISEVSTSEIDLDEDDDMPF